MQLSKYNSTSAILFNVTMETGPEVWVFSFPGKKLVLKALTPFQPGEEVSSSFFVPHFSVFVETNIIEFKIIVSLSSQHNPLFAQVSENYGQVFYFKSKQERQRELEARYIK